MNANYFLILLQGEKKKNGNQNRKRKSDDDSTENSNAKSNKTSTTNSDAAEGNIERKKSIIFFYVHFKFFREINVVLYPISCILQTFVYIFS